MPIWKFSTTGGEVRYGNRKRATVTGNGCNEPYKNRYWCPKRQWFRRKPCPFINRQECENFEVMCGSI